MKYLTIQQTAEALAVSEDTVRRMLPKLGAVDLSGGRGGKRLIRIPEEHLQDYLHDCRILPPVKIERMKQVQFYIERRKA